jgi:hypothetical protein
MELFQLPYWGLSPQPAPTFFLRKFSVTPFGVFDEVLRTGTVFLFSQLIGKTNSNHVLSILKLVIDRKKLIGSQARTLRLNFDNCNVQKCYLLIAFAMRLVFDDLYDLVEIHFKIAGHTKFNPDRMFGWLADLGRDKDIFEINDVLRFVADEKRLFGQRAQTSYTVESLENFDKDCNAEHFFDYKKSYDKIFKSFQTISSMHQFRMRKVDGSVILEMKEFSTDSIWTSVKFFKKNPTFGALEKLKKVPMKEKKIKDLSTCLQYIPSGELSYLKED